MWIDETQVIHSETFRVRGRLKAFSVDESRLIRIEQKAAAIAPTAGDRSGRPGLRSVLRNPVIALLRRLLRKGRKS